MANEINFGYPTGKTLTFSVYTSAGAARETATAMTETPAASGLYLGSPTTIEAGDNVIIKEGSDVVGCGEYLPEINADTIHDEVVEGTITLRQAIRLFLSVLTGKSSGGGTATLKFRDIADSKDRLVVEVDGDGNRLDVTTRDGT